MTPTVTALEADVKAHVWPAKGLVVLRAVGSRIPRYLWHNLVMRTQKRLPTPFFARGREMEMMFKVVGCNRAYPTPLVPRSGHLLISDTFQSSVLLTIALSSAWGLCDVLLGKTMCRFTRYFAIQLVESTSITASK